MSREQTEIDWNDNTKRKDFRLMLQRVYPDYDALDMFVDEELNENLADIASDGNLKNAARALITKMRSLNRLDEVFSAFERENPNDPGIAGLQIPSLIAAPSEIEDSDWDELFNSFQSGDLLELKRAFELTTQSALIDEFKGKGLFDIKAKSITAIRDCLEDWDNPKLSVLFASRAIDELARSNPAGDCDLTTLKNWRDRLADKHNIDRTQAQPATEPATKTGYLLVSVINSGRVTKGELEVTLSPELQIEGSTAKTPADLAIALRPLEKVK